MNVFCTLMRKYPELKNAHSVMAFWSQGHLVTYFSERPVVANNFGFGFMDSLNFFFAKSEEEALAIAQRRRVRYVFSLDIFPVINQYSRVVGQPDYFFGQVNNGRRIQHLSNTTGPPS